MIKIIKRILIIFYCTIIKFIVFFFIPTGFNLDKNKPKTEKYSLVILCTIKNSGPQLQKTLKRFSKIQGYFSQFKVLMYENNSTDSTKDVLHDVAKKYSFLEYYSFDYTQEELDAIAPVRRKPQMIPCFVQHVAYGRNFLLEKVKSIASQYTYTLVFDPDVFYFNPYTIVKLINHYAKIDFDAVTVNGLTKFFRYRDAYAFRSAEYPYGPEYLGQWWWENIRAKIQKRYFGKKIIPVYSSFGGAGLYKTETYITSSYSSLPTPDFFEMQKNIINANTTTLNEKYSNAAPIMEPIANTHYTAPIICEHVPFNYKLYNAGHTKQYIDTSWKILFL